MLFTKRIKNKDNSETEKAVHENVDNYQIICRNLLKKLPINGVGKIIMVTSCNILEDSSEISINLAETFIRQNNKTMLVDGNFGKTNFLYQNLEVPASEFGFSSVLLGRKSINDVVIKLKSGIDFLPLGSLPGNSMELIHSQKMADLFAYFQVTYDMTILNVGAVRSLEESIAISKYADGVVMVIYQNTTEKSDAIITKDLLSHANANVLGAVIAV